MKKIRKKRKFLTLAVLLMLIAGCQKDVPESDIYRLSDVIVTGTNDENIGAYALVAGEVVNGLVPFDGSSSMSYKVQLVFPPEAGDVQITPASPGVFDFTNPVNFKATFRNGTVKNYRITLTKDTLDLPVISAFSIPWARNVELISVNAADKDIYVRLAAGSPVDNITPMVKFNKPTVIQRSPMSGPVDFSNGPVDYILENGTQTATYKVYVRDYGYGQIAYTTRFTLQYLEGRRLTRLTDVERSTALDVTGSYIYVANGSVIQRYTATGAYTQTPGSVNIGTTGATSQVENVCPLVNGAIDSKFYACNKIQNGGMFRIYNWTTYNVAPKLVAEVDLTAKGATIDCFTWRLVNDRVYVYLVDTGPMYKPVPENPKVYILKDLTPNNLITSYEERTINGVVNTGFVPGPHTELINITGTEEFILNNGLSSPLLISSAMSVSKVFPETPRLPKTISGIRTFEFKGGKYISYVEFSTTDTEEPSAYLNIIDMTKKGFSATINDIINEGASETTLKNLTVFRYPFGNAANTQLFASTSYNPVGETMRILASVAGNGIVIIAWQ